MVRFLADENFNNQIVRGVLWQSPSKVAAKRHLITVLQRTEEIYW
jgi:2-phospho-L-lactate transferase/gluconeogenesis factor (CofD/UPF0052 family)